MILEIAIVIVLTVINGILALSELAIVSSRPARLKVMAGRGRRGAATALLLAEDPGRFLSAVQSGITLVGVLSGAYSGATLGQRLAETLLAAGLAPSLAQTLGVGGVVVVITYLSLIFGELVPKRVALRSPEAVAVRVAPAMQALAVGAAPLVWLLDRSGRLVLRALGQVGDTDPTLTDEEIRLMISEAESAGVMEEAETRMLAGVMRIADRNARGLMTPRHDVELVDADATPLEVLAQFRDSGFSRLPVRDGGDDAIVGVLILHDFLDRRSRGDKIDLRRLMQKVPVVRDGLPALEVIETLRAAPVQMLLVYDEYGHFEGIITPMDVLEGITGEFLDEDDPEPKMITRDDGSLLVAGWMPVDEFAEQTGIELRPDRDYSTVAGFILDQMGVLPAVGAVLELPGWRIEVVDLDGRRIDKLLVSRH